MSKLVTPKGRAGWSQLREARGFKGAEENKKFSQDLILDREHGEMLLSELQVIANKLHAQEIEKAKMRGKNVRYAPPVINYKDVEGGGIQLSFKRKETDGAPAVVGADNQPYTGRINRDTTLQIAFEVVPYVLASVFGVTLKLLAVKVLEEVLTTESLADLFGAPSSPAPAPQVKKTAIEDLF